MAMGMMYVMALLLLWKFLPCITISGLDYYHCYCNFDCTTTIKAGAAGLSPPTHINLPTNMCVIQAR